MDNDDICNKKKNIGDQEKEFACQEDGRGTIRSAYDANSPSFRKAEKHDKRMEKV